MLAFAALLLPWLPGLSGAFVFDDHGNIVGHPAFSAPLASATQWWEATLSSTASGIGRPLAIATLLINFHFAGLDPYWFKLTNVLIHVANGLLLFQLLRVLFAAPAAAGCLKAAALDADRTALLLAAFWTCLPIHVSGVLMVVQRMELLAQTFVLLALLVYLSGRSRMNAGRRGGMLRVVAGLVALPAVGILCKESAVLVPVYAFAIEVYLLRFGCASTQDLRRLLLVHAAVATIALSLAAVVVPGLLYSGIWAERGFSVGERLLTESRVLWTYAHWIALPDLRAMGIYHDDVVVSRGWLQPVTTLVSVVAWLAVIALAIVRARRPSLLALGVTWFLSAHLLTATIIPLELVFEHRNYFASIGLLLVAFAAMLKVRDRFVSARAGLLVGTVALLPVYAGVTALRTHEWGDDLRLTVAEAARSPDSPRAIYELGRLQYSYSGHDPGSPWFSAAVDAFTRASELPGASAMPLQALMIARSSAGQSIEEEHWSKLRQLLTRRMDTQSVVALQSLVRCQLDGRCKFPDQLARTLAVAAERRPQNAEVLAIYSHLARLSLGDIRLADELMHRAVEIAPGSPIMHYQWGQALAVRGDFAAALASADRIDALDPWRRHRSKSAALRKLVDDLRALPDAPGRGPEGG